MNDKEFDIQAVIFRDPEPIKCNDMVTDGESTFYFDRKYYKATKRPDVFEVYCFDNLPEWAKGAVSYQIIGK